jgi:hypothetical protein
VFGWLRRVANRSEGQNATGDLSVLATLPKPRLVEAFADLVARMDNASRALVLIAYPNAKIIIGIALAEGVRGTCDGLPKTPQEAMSFAFRAVREASSEAGKRRATWLALGYVLNCVSVEHRESELNERVASIWMEILQADDALRVALTENVLFDASEKAFFDASDSTSGLQMSMSMQAPKHLRKCAAWNAEYI